MPLFQQIRNFWNNHPYLSSSLATLAGVVLVSYATNITGINSTNNQKPALENFRVQKKEYVIETNQIIMDNITLTIGPDSEQINDISDLEKLTLIYGPEKVTKELKTNKITLTGGKKFKIKPMITSDMSLTNSSSSD